VLDEYILRAKKVRAAKDPESIDKIAREIVSTFHSEIPNLSSYRGSYVIGENPRTHTATDLDKLIGKLCVLRDEKDAELYGQYGLSTLTESIRRLENALILDGEEELGSVYESVDYMYANKLNAYTDGLGGYGYSPESYCEEQTQLRIDKLKLYRDEELRHHKLAEAQAASVAVNTTATAAAVNTTVIDIRQVNEQINQLPDSELSDDDKTFLKGMLVELEQSVRSGKECENKLKKALSWLADKGIDVAIAVLPFIVQIIQSLG
jgi:hypothetical protein